MLNFLFFLFFFIYIFSLDWNVENETMIFVIYINSQYLTLTVYFILINNSINYYYITYIKVIIIIRYSSLQIRVIF